MGIRYSMGKYLNHIRANLQQEQGRCFEVQTFTNPAVVSFKRFLGLFCDLVLDKLCHDSTNKEQLNQTILTPIMIII